MNRDRERLGRGSGSFFFYSSTAHSYIFISHTHSHTRSHALPRSWKQPGTVFPRPPSANVVTLARLQSRRALLIHHVSEDVCVRACARVFVRMYGPGLLRMLVPTHCGAAARVWTTYKHRLIVHGRALVSIFSIFLPP